MWRAIAAVKEGQADGVVSAGNTGALLAMAMLVLRRLQGIDRPAIASFFPTLRGETVMLDLGANIRCNERNLVEFAIMGEVFARTILGIENPTVGLLNVGAEETKGNDDTPFNPSIPFFTGPQIRQNFANSPHSALFLQFGSCFCI